MVLAGPKCYTLAKKKSKQVRHKAYKQLVMDLNCQLQRTLREIPAIKLEQQAASSHVRMTYMLPVSQLQRKQISKQKDPVIT